MLGGWLGGNRGLLYEFLGNEKIVLIFGISIPDEQMDRGKQSPGTSDRDADAEAQGSWREAEFKPAKKRNFVKFFCFYSKFCDILLCSDLSK